MKAIPAGFMTPFLDGLEGRYDVAVEAILKPIRIDDDGQIIFNKFTLGPEIGMVREISHKRGFPISALSYSGVEFLDDDTARISFTMYTRVVKQTWNGYTDHFAVASLYTKRYIVLPQMMDDGSMLIVCRSKGYDELFSNIDLPDVYDVVHHKLPDESQLYCGQLYIETIGKEKAYLKYACGLVNKKNPAKAAVIAAYVAVQSLID